jgi:DNA-binding response OmpR family regulator
MSLPRVLFVDDEPAICSAIAKLLSFHGIEVDAVTSGHEARRLVSRGYDALVLDYRLAGGETGDALYSALTTAAPNLTLRTIFVTGDISEPVHERIESTGCPMLVKPFEIGLLISLVRAVIQDAGAKDAASDATIPHDRSA